MSHTPGPWRHERDERLLAGVRIVHKREPLPHEGYFRSNDGDWTVMSADGPIARVTFKGEAKRGKGYDAPDPEGQANARLIAAAPEMAALLARLLEEYRTWVSGDPCATHSADEHPIVIEARALLARLDAEGAPEVTQ